jgi:hypothetical protein
MELEDAQDEIYLVNFLLEDEENKADPPPQDSLRQGDGKGVGRN